MSLMGTGGALSINLSKLYTQWHYWTFSITYEKNEYNELF